MKDEENNKNGYSLSRQWFDFAFENPDKINTNHCALWFWLMELNNQLGWKEKFGLPTYHSMEALGIKNYRTFKTTLDDLIKFGFVRLIQKARNNHTSNIIELVKITKSGTKSSISQCISQVQVTATIDKLLNKEKPETDKDGEPVNVSEIILYLNEKSDKNYKSNSKQTNSLILARHNEGWHQSDFIKVIDNKVAEWKGDANMDKYLRPVTLFGNKFESYLNQRILPRASKRLSSQQNLGEMDYHNKQ